MKRFTISLISIILSSFFLICFSACGDTSKQKTVNGKTAEQVYEQIVGSISSANNNFSFTIDYTAKETLSSQDNTPLTQRKLTTTLNRDNDNYVYTTILDMSSLAMSGTDLYTKKTNTFFNQTLYRLTEQTFNNQPFTSKVKGTYSYAHSLLILGKDDSEFNSPIYAFTKNQLKDAMFNNAESELYFELLIKGDNAKAFVRNILLNTNVTNSNYSCSEISYKFYVDTDANFERIAVAFIVETTTNSSNYKYQYNGTITLFDVGTTSVSAPTDADSYANN